MLVTFSCKAWADITMFGDVAVRLLNLMGHPGSIPGALLAKDIPEALNKLKGALEEDDALSQPETDDDSEEDNVSLALRAYPLIELLTAAAKKNCSVMWNN
ncbi:MAG: DUF1840 domain-containing protein [Gammaproteobacteria bacterium]|nr:DUF1840 domain-containing protein [Gammaproteobacteria bacterium]MDH3466399.1 DUF1840 domain-containing protein [Gammaproteobacteria bacterium]